MADSFSKDIFFRILQDSLGFPGLDIATVQLQGGVMGVDLYRKWGWMGGGEKGGEGWAP